MQIKIRQIGSSQGIILNKTLMRLFDLHVGDDVEVKVKNNKLVLEKAKQTD